MEQKLNPSRRQANTVPYRRYIPAPHYRVLAVSDKVEPRLYGPSIAKVTAATSPLW